MEQTETVQGAADSIKEAVEDFWPVLEADDELKDPELADSKAEITQLMEGAADNIDAIRKILNDLRERE